MSADDVAERFWRNVDIRPASEGDACWLWMGRGTPNATGHLRTTVRGAKWYVQRAAWTLAVGPLPSGALVRHAVCSQPRCVRPSHLSPYGGALANARDRDALGNRTLVRGAAYWSSKLTAEQAAAVRAARKSGCSVRDLAARFALSDTTVRRLLHGLTYPEAGT